MCTRCGGSGYIPKWSHIANGVCFQCGGRQSVSVAGTRTERLAEEQRKERLNEIMKEFDDLPF